MIARPRVKRVLPAPRPGPGAPGVQYHVLLGPGHPLLHLPRVLGGQVGGGADVTGDSDGDTAAAEVDGDVLLVDDTGAALHRGGGHVELVHHYNSLLTEKN